MSLTVVEYQLKISGNLVVALKKASKQAKRTESLIIKTFKRISTSAKKAAAVIGSAFSRAFKKMRQRSGGGGIGGLVAGVGITAGLRSIIKTTGEFQQARTTMETLAGKKQGGNLFQQLTDFANRTPFINTQVNKAAQTLLAFGRSAKAIPDDLERIGSISAGNSDRFQSLALVFGQVKAAGRLMGQDLLQFINAGFNPLLILSKKTGKSMGKLREEMSSGAISFDMVRDAIKTATDKGGMFNGLMEKMSKTLPGLLSTLQGKFQLIQVAIGESLVPVLKPLIAWFGKLSDWIVKNKEQFKAHALAVMKVVAVLGSLTLAFKILSAVISANPIVMIAGALIGITTYIHAIYNDSKQIVKLSDNIKSISTTLAKNYGEQASKAKFLFTTLKHVKKTSERYKDTIDRINESYGSLLTKKLTVNSKTEELLIAEKKILGVIKQQVKAQAYKAKAAEVSGRLVENQYKAETFAIKQGLSYNDFVKKMDALYKMQKDPSSYTGVQVQKARGDISAMGGRAKYEENVKVLKQIIQDKKSLDFFASKLLGADMAEGATASLPTGGSSTAKAKSAKENIIGAGGIKSFNINISKLIGVETMKTSNIRQGAQDTAQEINRAILRAIAEVNPSMA